MIRLVLTSALMLLALASTAISQSVMDFTGSGTRAAGMGNAFIAVSNDASAASWNPAGLIAQEKMVMGLDFDSFSPKGKYYTPGNTFLNDGSFSSINQLSIVAPFRLRGRAFVGAFSYGRSFQEFWSSGFDSAFYYYNIDRDSSLLTVQQTAYEHPNLIVINGAVATKLSQNLSAGLAINIYSGQNVGNSLEKDVLPELLHPLYAPQYIRVEQTVKIIDTAKYSGANFTLGAKYETEKLDIGFMARTPFALNSESDIKIDSQRTYQDIVVFEGSDTIYVDNQLVKYDMPWIIGFGLGFRATESLLLAADMEYRGFGGGEIRVRDSMYIKPGQNNEEFYTVLNPDWNNALTFRVGAEFLWETGLESFPIVPIRAGFGSVPLPLSQTSYTGVAGTTAIDKTSMTYYTFGLGVKWSQIYLDAAWTRSNLDLNLTGTSLALNTSATTLSFGFTGYF